MAKARARSQMGESAPNITYFDDIGAYSRVDGIEAVRAYRASLEGETPPREDEMVDPKVQSYGETGILTMKYQTTMADGQPGPPWKATSVYRLDAGEWRMVHAHWSLVKEE